MASSIISWKPRRLLQHQCPLDGRIGSRNSLVGFQRLLGTPVGGGHGATVIGRRRVLSRNLPDS